MTRQYANQSVGQNRHRAPTIAVGEIHGNRRVVGVIRVPKPYRGEQRLRVIGYEAACLNCNHTVIKSATFIRVRQHGCRHCSLMRRGETGLNALYKSYRSRAEERGLAFLLSRDELEIITSQDCFYCGSKPSQIICPTRQSSIRGSWGEYEYNGIDRVNNDGGYVHGNCVPCCGICNTAKMALSFDDFSKYLIRFADRIRSGNLPAFFTERTSLPA